MRPKLFLLCSSPWPIGAFLLTGFVITACDAVVIRALHQQNQDITTHMQGRRYLINSFMMGRVSLCSVCVWAVTNKPSYLS